MNDEDNKLARRAKALFDDSVGGLDAERLSKLNRARQRALDELDRRPALAGWTRLLPAGGVAAAAVLVALLVLRTDDVAIDVPIAPTAAETDFELLIEEDSFEMLEDLEFYSWMELDDLEATQQQG